MQYTDQRTHLHVEFETKECTIPKDELAHMEEALLPLREAIYGLPRADLWFNIDFHPRSQTHHVQAKLKLPGSTIITGDRQPYLDSAFQACVNKLTQRVEAHKKHPPKENGDEAERESLLDREIIAPEEPEAGPV